MQRGGASVKALFTKVGADWLTIGEAIRRWGWIPPARACKVGKGGVRGISWLDG